MLGCPVKPHCQGGPPIAIGGMGGTPQSAVWPHNGCVIRRVLLLEFVYDPKGCENAAQLKAQTLKS